MTTNNEVKAPRPCTLPWGVTFDFNNFKFCSLRGGLNRNDTLQRVYVKLKDGDTLYSPYYTEEQAWEVYSKVILAIASAQRPWLKAEGFQFVEGTVYEVLTERTAEDGSIYHARNTVYYHASNSTLISCYDNGKHKNDGYTGKSAFWCYSKNALAFKPISDSQEAWDAVAGVEVYNEGVV